MFSNIHAAMILGEISKRKPPLPKKIAWMVGENA